MDAVLSLIATNSPILVFFAVGAGFAALSRDVQMPPIFSRLLAMALLFAIGVKGGASLGEAGLGGAVVPAILAGAALSVMVTLLAFAALARATGVERGDAAGIAMHYGSISIVTFAGMTLLLNGAGIAYDGWMVAVAVTMEVPAIATGLLLAHVLAPARPQVAGTGGGAASATLGGGSGAASGAGALPGAVAEGLGRNRGIALLLGAFLLGWLAGEIEAGWDEKISGQLFPTILILFLIDQGLRVGRRLPSLRRRFDRRLALFALAMPLAGATLGLVTGAALGLGVGNTALLMALAGSASYIAAPAATRIALPGARPELYLTLSLCLTLPFNLIVGLPLYLALAGWLAG